MTFTSLRANAEAASASFLKTAIDMAYLVFIVAAVAGFAVGAEMVLEALR